MLHTSYGTPTFTGMTLVLSLVLPPCCVADEDIQYEYEHIIAPFVYKLGNFSDKQVFSGNPALSFLTNWTSPIDDPDAELEKVTGSGKQDAAALGAIFAQRYSGILGGQGEDSWKIWAAVATRDQVRFMLATSVALLMNL